MSANTFDSLGDAYLANGQNELALRASEKAIELLAKIRRRRPEEGDSRQRRAEDREAQGKREKVGPARRAAAMPLISR